MLARRPLLLLALLCALLLAAPATAGAIALPTLTAKLEREMRHAGPFSGAFVRDLETGRQLFAVKQDVPRPPASVEKLFTTSTALLRMGPDEVLRTIVAGKGTLDANGVWHGDLYLRGSGDPSLDKQDIAALATTIATEAGIARVDGSVVGDESEFDTQRGSVLTGFAYDSDLGGMLGALTVGRGFARDGLPAADAARRLAKALRAAKVEVSGKTRTGTTPGDAVELAGVASPPVRDLIRLINAPSDNFYAETLLKALGSRYAGTGSLAGGASVVREQLATFGIHPRIVDGSGLSRANRTTPRQVVRLLQRMHAQELGATFEASLAVAGRTGTLRKRMRGTPAQDRCKAKTGTLNRVSALAGVCTAANGHAIAFGFLMTGTSLARAHGVQDRMAAALARYSVPAATSAPAEEPAAAPAAPNATPTTPATPAAGGTAAG